MTPFQALVWAQQLAPDWEDVLSVSLPELTHSVLVLGAEHIVPDSNCQLWVKQLVALGDLRLPFDIWVTNQTLHVVG